MTQKLEDEAINEIGDSEFDKIVLRNLKEDRQLLARLAKV